ncbi:MAG: hypothetical protein IPL78_32605 [Chloroflexi bacterium]|nr:hypothetical protein [Chloroflexota bacterium]
MFRQLQWLLFLFVLALAACTPNDQAEPTAPIVLPTGTPLPATPTLAATFVGEATATAQPVPPHRSQLSLKKHALLPPMKSVAPCRWKRIRNCSRRTLPCPRPRPRHPLSGKKTTLS